MLEKILHTFEAGRRGKPDELDSGIATLIGAYLLKSHPKGRFDLRVSGSFNGNRPLVRISGEVSESYLMDKDLILDLSWIVLARYNWIHKSHLRLENIEFIFNLKPQAEDLAGNSRAGDSGNPIAVAYRNAPGYLPWERFIAVGLRDLFDTIYFKEGQVPEGIARLSGISHLSGLKSDGKVSVDALYDGANLAELKNVTFALEHAENLSLKELRDKVTRITKAYLELVRQRYPFSLGEPRLFVNGAGAWNRGGWRVDEGSREAKPYRDSFASYGVQEDSFSGEDPSKPSGTGTFLARFIAVQIVGKELADFARVTLSYVIGRDEVDLNVYTNGTGKLGQRELEALIRKQFPLRITDAIERFGLRDPQIYQRIVQDSDYFQNPELPWNKVDNHP